MRLLLLPTAVLSLAACGRTDDVTDGANAADAALLNAASRENTRDPLVADALGAPIMVDPTLQQSANGLALRPPPRPDSGMIPPDIARPDPVDPRSLRHAPPANGPCPRCSARGASYTLAALAATEPAFRACATVTYSARWAVRLAAEMPLYPDARLVEAAGNATAPCRLRAASFATSAAAGKVIDWYFTRAVAARYETEHRTADGIATLAGTRGGDAFVIYATPRADGGADVDLLANTGT